MFRHKVLTGTCAGDSHLRCGPVTVPSILLVCLYLSLFIWSWFLFLFHLNKVPLHVDPLQLPGSFGFRGKQARVKTAGCAKINTSRKITANKQRITRKMTSERNRQTNQWANLEQVRTIDKETNDKTGRRQNSNRTRCCVSIRPLILSQEVPFLWCKKYILLSV